MRSAPAPRTIDSRPHGTPQRPARRMPVASYETDPARYGRRFVVQTQNAAKPAYWVAFEYAVLAGTIGSLLYIAFGY